MSPFFFYPQWLGIELDDRSVPIEMLCFSLKEDHRSHQLPARRVECHENVKFIMITRLKTKGAIASAVDGERLVSVKNFEKN